MNAFHINDAVDSAIIHLNDALCSFERETTREYYLILIPVNKKEHIHTSLNGKPYACDDVREFFDNAMLERRAGQ